MITAQEARQQTEDVTKGLNLELLKEIESKISQVIHQGKYNIMLNKNLPVGVSNHLKEMGYSIKSMTDPRDGTVLVTISW